MGCAAPAHGSSLFFSGSHCTADGTGTSGIIVSDDVRTFFTEGAEQIKDSQTGRGGTAFAGGLYSIWRIVLGIVFLGNWQPAGVDKGTYHCGRGAYGAGTERLRGGRKGRDTGCGLSGRNDEGAYSGGDELSAHEFPSGAVDAISGICKASCGSRGLSGDIFNCNCASGKGLRYVYESYAGQGGLPCFSGNYLWNYPLSGYLCKSPDGDYSGNRTGCGGCSMGNRNKTWHFMGCSGGNTGCPSLYRNGNCTGSIGNQPDSGRKVLAGGYLRYSLYYLYFYPGKSGTKTDRKKGRDSSGSGAFIYLCGGAAFRHLGNYRRPSGVCHYLAGVQKSGEAPEKHLTKAEYSLIIKADRMKSIDKNRLN